MASAPAQSAEEREPRRRFLAQAVGWTAAAFSIGQFGCTPAGEHAPAAGTDADDSASPPFPYPVIDAHLHTNFFHAPTRAEATARGIDFTPTGLAAEMRAAGVVRAFSLGYEPGEGEKMSHEAANPMVRRPPEAEIVPGLQYIGGINPYRLDDDNLAAIDSALADGRVRGLKIYLGYYHLPPEDPRYRPVYELAGRHGRPVLLHTGDTYSRTAKLRFAHPLPIDDIAVDFPETRFVICHLGNPWTLDAAEVIYKNPNVYADLSGFLVGDAAYFARVREEGSGFADVIRRIQEAFTWVEDPTKFLYGSDWPLVPMLPYRDLIRQAIPPEHRRAVFHDNAARLFALQD